MHTIKLSKGYEAIIDDDDADLLAFPYYASVNSQTGHVYARRTRPRGARPSAIYLHREIAERLAPIPRGYDVDHDNGNTLDCRRANLKAVPHRVNLWNQKGAGRDSQSGIRGVRQRRGRWAAYICEGRKMLNLGTFDTPEEAQAARAAAEAVRKATFAPG